MLLPLYQVDAFSDTVFGGNPAAICPLESWIAEELMQKIAAENNLSETAFFVPAEQGFYIRWFTPLTEVNLCGHATLASAHVLFEHLGFAGNTVVFDSKSGLLKVSQSADWYTMDFPADTLEKVACPDSLFKGLGKPPKEVWKGKDDFMAIYQQEEEVQNLTPDFSLIARLPARGVIATAPGNQKDFVSRGFFPAAGINEDPVTGSAHTTLTPYWSKKLGKNSLTARQISKRGGELNCQMKGARVLLSGQAVTYLTGNIRV